MDSQKVGWVKLYRKSLDSQIFANPEILKLWILCLLKASHKTQWIHVDGVDKPIKIEPGQFLTGRFMLHQEYYPCKRKKQKTAVSVWRWLVILKKMQNLDIKTYSKYSIVTIINWDTYQCEQTQNEQLNVQQMNNRCATDDQQMITYKNEEECIRMKKNINKESIKKSSPKKISKKLADKPDNIDQNLWEDFLLLRKTKKAPFTITALNSFKREAQKVNRDLGWVFQKCIERGWCGFEAGWVKEKDNNFDSQKTLQPQLQEEIDYGQSGKLADFR